MTLSPEDRERIVEAMARATHGYAFRVIESRDEDGLYTYSARERDLMFDRCQVAKMNTARALNAALSAGLADAIQRQLGAELAAAVDNPQPPADGLRELMQREPMWAEAIRAKALEEAANVALAKATLFNGDYRGVWANAAEAIALAIYALRNKETNG